VKYIVSQNTITQILNLMVLHGRIYMGYIDIHAHILPGLDDGSKSMEQSIAMLRTAYSQGITSIVATPHNMPGKGCPPVSIVTDKVNELNMTADSIGIPVKIYTGTEYYFRQEILELFQKEEAITLGNSDCVLVEFEPMVERIYFRNALRDILATAYIPVIAHVERYAKIMQDASILKELKKMGVLIQVNTSSVTGDNGFAIKRNVRKLLKEQLVDFVGTDAHSDGHRAPLMDKCARLLCQKYDTAYADALLFENAENLGMVF
jgi:protein-tyrosine phosphatase